MRWSTARPEERREGREAREWCVARSTPHPIWPQKQLRVAGNQQHFLVRMKLQRDDGGAQARTGYTGLGAQIPQAASQHRETRAITTSHHATRRSSLPKQPEARMPGFLG